MCDVGDRMINIVVHEKRNVLTINDGRFPREQLRHHLNHNGSDLTCDVDVSCAQRE